LEHVKIAVAIAGVERFDGHSNQEVALSRVAHSLPAGGVAHAFHLVQRVRHMVSEGASFQDPLAVGLRERGKGQEQDSDGYFLVHLSL
jgi:Na+-transporting NADH:ubiquinone oxidoreductase subunit NqrA